ncbi:MAG: ABC transporter ATP-binding protein [Clostridium sp.]|nr:ABC transporter ATP-binding protein [Clostridium sp.]
MKKYIRKNLMVVIIFVVVLIIENTAAIWVQFLKGDLLNLAIAGAGKQTLYKGLLLLGVIVLELTFMYFEFISTNKFNYLCVKALKEDLFSATLKKSYPEFNKNSIGEYVTKFTNDVETIKNDYFSCITMVIMFIMKIVFVSAALIFLNVKLALLTFILLTMPLYVPKLAEKRLQNCKNSFLKNMESFLEKLNDYLQGFELIKNFSIECKIREKFIYENSKAMKSSYVSSNTQSLVRIISACMSYLSYFIVVAFSAYLVLTGEFNPGQFFIAVNMIDQLSYPIIAISGCIQGIISVKDLNKNLEKYCEDKKVDMNKGIFISNFKEGIEFNNVSFSYEADKPILKDISLLFEKGKKYIIKGKSGFGKTTLINLFLKYYMPDKGQILIDKVDVNQIENVYDHVSVVRQENFLFKDTLRNNLTMYEDIPDESLFEVLRKLNLHSFANEVALNMTIGSGGVSLSGGEAKRISIARALLKNKDILILDEPLANLDKETTIVLENEILNLKDYTIIMITHVLSEDKECEFDMVYNFV